MGVERREMRSRRAAFASPHGVLIARAAQRLDAKLSAPRGLHATTDFLGMPRAFDLAPLELCPCEILSHSHALLHILFEG